MALSNILREPRREITESIAGIGVFIIPVWLDYHFALWAQAVSGGAERGMPVPLGMIAGIVVTLAIFAIALFTHFVGEGICDALANRGFDPRPKNRNR